MSSYTRWYREGSVSASAGGNAVTGTGTFWKTAGLNAGDILKLGGYDYEIIEITDDTHLTVTGTINATLTNSAYAIIRNFTSTMQSKIAAEVSGLLNDYGKYLNTSQATIYGKSAYEIAKANGFSGSESEWLESLKADNEWSTLNARTRVLNLNESGAIYRPGSAARLHNSIGRGKYLGQKPSATQMAAIRAGTYDDMWIGDYWETTDCGEGNEKTRLIIADFGYYNFAGGSYGIQPPSSAPAWKPHVLCFVTGDTDTTDVKGNYGLRCLPEWGQGATTLTGIVMNDTATTEGGFLGTRMWTEFLPWIINALEDCYGEIFLPFRVPLSNAVTNGVESGWVYTDTKICLANRAMLFAGAWAQEPNARRLKEPDRQVSLAALSGGSNVMGIQTHTWLRNVVSATNFAWTSWERTGPRSNPANNTDTGVEPYVVLG